MHHNLPVITHLPRPIATPLRLARDVVEVATFLTRDLRCSSTGHDPVGTPNGIACRRCGKRGCTYGGQMRWTA